MTTPEKLLVTLLPRSISASDLGTALRIPMLVAKAHCDRHRTAGLVDSYQFEGSTLYVLTRAGITEAKDLQSTQLAL